MIASQILYSTIARATNVLFQFVFILAFAKYLPVAEMGGYSLSVSIATPVIGFIMMDTAVLIVARCQEHKNLFVVLTPPAIVAALSFIVGACCAVFGIYDVVSVLSLVIVFKFGEAISELDYALLRRNHEFHEYSWLASLRYTSVYGVAALLIVLGFGAIFVISYISVISLLLSYWSFRRLISKGWFWKRDWKGVSLHLRKHVNLGFAMSVKLGTSNILRYYIMFQYGVETLGYLVPVFYAMTVLSYISTVVENVISPRLARRLSGGAINGDFVKSARVESALLLGMYAIVVVSAMAFCGYYYSMFYPEMAAAFKGLIVILSIGWIFNVSRSILKVLSYSIGLKSVQHRVQIHFLIMMFVSVVALGHVYGLSGAFIGFVFSNMYICLIYLARMNVFRRLWAKAG